MRSAPLLAILLFMLAPAASAASSVTLSISVKESGCATGTLCFSVDSGSLSDIETGTNVTVNFHNTGSMEHEILATAASKADPAHKDTTEDGKLGSAEDIAAGDSGSFSFVAPSDAKGVYFWCGQEGHEANGMYLTASYGVATTAKKASVPGLEIAAILGAVAALAIALRRR